nr:hypothetical protein [Acinetobacter oleivorans]
MHFLEKFTLKNLSTGQQFLIYLLICIFPALIIWKFQIYPILLTENAILYLHATSAQVIAALIALSLVAYTHINSELNQKLMNDISLDDAIFLTKNNAFKDLTITLLVGVLSISASLLVLVSFEYIIFQDFFITISCISLLIFTSTLMRFVHRSFSPEAIQKNNDKVLEESKNELKELIADSLATTTEGGIQTVHTEEFDREALKEPASDSLESSLGKFFIVFSSFEDKLRKTYSKYNGYIPDNRTGSLRNIINSLVNNFQIIPHNLHKEILSLVKIRNSLAHASHETNISPQEINYYIRLIHDLEEKINFDFDIQERDKPYIQSTIYKIPVSKLEAFDKNTQEKLND